MGERGWFGRDAPWLGDTKLGGCSIGKPVVQTVYLLANFKTAHTLPQASDYAGKFMPGHRALARRSILRLRGRKPAQLGGRYSSGAHADQDLACSGLRLRHLDGDQR